MQVKFDPEKPIESRTPEAASTLPANVQFSSLTPMAPVQFCNLMRLLYWPYCVLSAKRQFRRSELLFSFEVTNISPFRPAELPLNTQSKNVAALSYVSHDNNPFANVSPETVVFHAAISMICVVPPPSRIVFSGSSSPVSKFALRILSDILFTVIFEPDTSYVPEPTSIVSATPSPAALIASAMLV